jgi:hypothetical protein
MFEVQEEREIALLVPILEEFNRSVNEISKFFAISENEVIETSFDTFFGQTLKLRYKDYQNIYLENGQKISGCMIRMEEKGRYPRVTGTHGMPRHIDMMFETFGSREISQNILEYSFRLIDITLESIFSSDKEKKKEKYNLAIQQPNFLYMMLQIAVKLLALDLYQRNEKINNSTLNYMTKMIEEDKEKLKRIFKNSFNDPDRMEEAVELYYVELSKYFEAFKNRKHNVTVDEMKKIGQESLILEKLGEKNLLTYVGYLLGRLKEKFVTQRILIEEKIITKK